MKRLASMIGIVAASVLFTSVPILSAEPATGGGEHKNVCLLASMNCRDNVDSIQQRIDNLNKEISKGTDVYTTNELRILIDKRDEAVKTLSSMGLGA